MYYSGRRVTFNGFTQAIDKEGDPLFFTDANGRRQPLMMGVSEFGVPETNEFIRGELHQKTHKVPAKFILWLPNGKIRKNCLGGISIDGQMYREMQENPDLYPDRVEKIKHLNLPMNIDFD